jgi:mannose-6-phosphate isomerase-like protein (cupin superfamily)
MLAARERRPTIMEIKNLIEVPPFITKDGSEIRELLAYRNSGIRNQSLAEARLPVGGATQEHYHVRTEEIYYITNGTGRIRINGETRDVKIGDAIAILPGQKHKLWNTGNETLRLLCCCTPAYEHEDTVIVETDACCVVRPTVAQKLWRAGKDCGAMVGEARAEVD